MVVKPTGAIRTLSRDTIIEMDQYYHKVLINTFLD